MDIADLLYPEDIDQRLNWPIGVTARLARRRQLPHVRLPDGSIRVRWSDVALRIQYISAADDNAKRSALSALADAMERSDAHAATIAIDRLKSLGVRVNVRGAKSEEDLKRIWAEQRKDGMHCIAESAPRQRPDHATFEVQPPLPSRMSAEDEENRAFWLNELQSAVESHNQEALRSAIDGYRAAGGVIVEHFTTKEKSDAIGGQTLASSDGDDDFTKVPPDDDAQNIGEAD